ncbi:unnamed protein product [Alopecurus aequalis]
MAAPRRRGSPPVLPDELVEEILLRLPPDDPACILRASVICKTWSTPTPASAAASTSSTAHPPCSASSATGTTRRPPASPPPPPRPSPSPLRIASHGGPSTAATAAPSSSPRRSIIRKSSCGLGLSEALDPHLKLWSREASDDTSARWVLSRVIHLGNLLPIGALVDADDRLPVVGFAAGANAIFINTVAGLFRIELHSERVTKVCDDRGVSACSLIPVVSFYIPHSRPEALRGEQHDLFLPPNPTGDMGGEEKKILERAQDLFDKGCEAIEERDFTNAIDCFRHALEIRVSHYGEFAPKCASTFYRYGLALVCKALDVKNSSDKVLKSVPNEESVKITATTSKDNSGSSEASGSNIEHVLPSEKANSDLDLAWKMLDIARAIVAKSPEKIMEKFNIFRGLAEVSMKREDRDTAIGYYLEALAILEHLVRPDHIKVVQLNFRICLAFELASKVGDAIPYCAKAISGCQSCIQNLKNNKALLTDKDVSATAAKGHSEKYNLEDKISLLSRILAQFQKKLKNWSKQC